MAALELYHLLMVGLIMLVIVALFLLMLVFQKMPQVSMPQWKQMPETANRVPRIAEGHSSSAQLSAMKITDATENAEGTRQRVKEIAANFENLKKTQTKILKTNDYSVLEGEVSVYHNGEFHKPKVVIVDPGNATEEEIMELMEFARSKFVKKEKE